MEQSREQFDYGLEECVIEASPDFDESPAGQPPAKKTRRRKMATKKEREHLVKEVRAFSLNELTTICLDATRFKLTEHVNPLVKEFAMAFEPSDIFFIVKCLRSLFAEVYEDCHKKKEKFIAFQFQWHQQCSILLVKNTTDLAQLNLDSEDNITTTLLTVRQEWVSFYQERKASHDVAKVFMLVFSAEIFNKLLKLSQSALQAPSHEAPTHASGAPVDHVDVYYRFGGATLASMLHGRYNAMKSEQTSQKEKISQEIHILQALNTKDKEKIPKYLQYRDKGHMYFPCEELIPFLQAVDKSAKTYCNDEGFRKYGKSLVQETVKLVHSESKHKEVFSTVLSNRLQSTMCFTSSAIDNVFSEFVSKLTNTRIQEFLDSFKATAAIKKGTASVSGQNLRDTLLTQHVNLKSKRK